MKKDDINSLKELRQVRKQLKQQEAILKNTISHQLMHGISSTRRGISKFTPDVNTQKMIQMGIMGYSIYRQVSTYQKIASKQGKKQSGWMKLVQAVVEMLLRK